MYVSNSVGSLYVVVITHIVFRDSQSTQLIGENSI